MSRRFGRNQRRRAREQMATLEHRLDESRHAAQFLTMRNAELCATIDDVEACLGPGFIGLPPRKLRGILAKRKDLHRPIYAADNKAQPVEMLVMEVRSETDRADHMMHIMVELDDRSVGYALSRTAIARAPVDVLVRRISYEVARHLTVLLREEGGR